LSLHETADLDKSTGQIGWTIPFRRSH